MRGGVATSEHQVHEQIRITPHPRTLRKARERVRWMVNDGLSARQIKLYLHRFVLWWVNTTRTWNYEELIQWFCDACFDVTHAAFAAGLLFRRIRESCSPTAYDLQSVGLAAAIAA